MYCQCGGCKDCLNEQISEIPNIPIMVNVGHRNNQLFVEAITAPNCTNVQYEQALREYLGDELYEKDYGHQIHYQRKNHG